MKKICTICKKEYNTSDFYSSGTGRKYLLSFCKKCANVKTAVWKKKNIETVREKDRLYQRERRKIRGLKAIESRKWRTEHPDKWKIEWLTNYLIKKGTIVRQNCVVCGKEKACAHHNNYNNPFDITWLCPLHHKQYHCGIIKI